RVHRARGAALPQHPRLGVAPALGPPGLGVRAGRKHQFWSALPKGRRYGGRTADTDGGPRVGRPWTTPTAALAALILAACGDEGTVESAEDVPDPTSTVGQDREIGDEVLDEETGYRVKEPGQWVE